MEVKRFLTWHQPQPTTLAKFAGLASGNKIHKILNSLHAHALEFVILSPSIWNSPDRYCLQQFCKFFFGREVYDISILLRLLTAVQLRNRSGNSGALLNSDLTRPPLKNLENTRRDQQCYRLYFTKPLMLHCAKPFLDEFQQNTLELHRLLHGCVLQLQRFFRAKPVALQKMIISASNSLNVVQDASSTQHIAAQPHLLKTHLLLVYVLDRHYHSLAAREQFVTPCSCMDTGFFASIGHVLPGLGFVWP